MRKFFTNLNLISSLFGQCTVSGGPKNVQIFTSERAKMMSSGRKHSEGVVPGKEHNADNRKLKNFVKKTIIKFKKNMM
jgi:hypothetical protein